uniref:Putative Colicin V production protein, cvpA-like (DedE protein) (Pur regulon 18 kDa protein) n=1 Tax=uncultured bacterium contig00061 TaxID=1181544 RepID=A0A806KNV0_9BACT|nr:putative Colicin V production protein, cvpA-like (dedE protein) (Pur regulon 18 kDa protein) [uncultured bacterium contig00061]
MGVAVIDFVLIGIIIIFTLRCAVRGFVSELLSVAALVFGLLLAIFFFRAGAVIVRRLFMPDVRVFPEIISFIAIFLIVYIVVKILELILKSIIDGIRLGGLDRLLGFAFGLAEGIIVVCLLLFLINIQPFVDPEFILGESFLQEYFYRL